MAMIDSMILCLVVEKSRKQGLRLMVVLFPALFGIKTILTVVEATYLPMLRPMVAPLLINGIITSSLSIMIAVLVCNTRYTEQTEENQSKINWHKPWYQWLWQFLAVAIVWMMLFVGFGAFVFLNVAKIFDPQALATYSNLDMPSWVLPFQGLRALLWVGLTLPLVTQLDGSKRNVASLTGCLFAGWIGSNLLLALDLPAGLRLAHLLEVGGESFVFGLMMVLIFSKKRKPLSTEE